MPSVHPPAPNQALAPADEDEASNTLQDAAALARALGDDEVQRLLAYARSHGDRDIAHLINRMQLAAERCRGVRARLDRYMAGSGLRLPEPGAVDDRIGPTAAHRADDDDDDGEITPTGVHVTSLSRTRRDRTG